MALRLQQRFLGRVQKMLQAFARLLFIRAFRLRGASFPVAAASECFQNLCHLHRMVRPVESAYELHEHPTPVL